MTMTTPQSTINPWAPPASDKPLPNLDGFETFYNIKVCAIGEDGDLIALGHAGKLRTIAAFNAYNRRVVGIGNLVGCVHTAPNLIADAMDNINHLWATVRPAPHLYDTWEITLVEGPKILGAFPVTYFNVG